MVAITIKDNEEYVGYLSTYWHTQESFCLSYSVRLEYRNRGLCTKTLKAFLKQYNPRTTDIYAWTLSDNIPSQRVLAKAGFEYLLNYGRYNWYQWCQQMEE